MKRDPTTYAKIRDQYDEWIQAEARRPRRAYLRRVDSSYSPPSESDSEMSRMIAATLGFGIGAVLLALSAYAFYTSSVWGGFGRDGAQVGYFVAGLFLFIAGIGGVLATWNHNFRVLVNRPSHS